MDLIDAVQNGKIDRVHELLDRGVNPNTRHINADSPLISASFDGNTEIVKLLLENLNMKSIFFSLICVLLRRP